MTVLPMSKPELAAVGSWLPAGAQCVLPLCQACSSLHQPTPGKAEVTQQKEQLSLISFSLLEGTCELKATFSYTTGHPRALLWEPQGSLRACLMHNSHQVSAGGGT